jgi:hypothetical protein
MDKESSIKLTEMRGPIAMTSSGLDGEVGGNRKCCSTGRAQHQTASRGCWRRAEADGRLDMQRWMIADRDMEIGCAWIAGGDGVAFRARAALFTAVPDWHGCWADCVRAGSVAAAKGIEYRHGGAAIAGAWRQIGWRQRFQVRRRKEMSVGRQR